MGKRVLLVSSQKSFMVNAMIRNLNSASFDVVHKYPEIKAVTSGEELPSVILLYLDEDVVQTEEFLIYMRDQLLDRREDFRTCLIGTEEEIGYVQKILRPGMIYGVFERPLNVKELVEKLNEMTLMDDREDRKKRILVVDDDSTMLRTLKLWLSDKYHIYMANSGANAISLLATKKVDLVLLDYEMPIASGPQVLQMIRSEPATKDVPVMFLTAKNDKESVMSVMELNPEKYLLKTMPPDVLLQNIDEFFIQQRMKD